MLSEKLEKILQYMKDDAHVPVGLTVFFATSAYHFLKHVDLGANYTNSLYALYGFLGAHNLTNQKYPDKPGDGDVTTPAAPSAPAA